MENQLVVVVLVVVDAAWVRSGTPGHGDRVPSSQADTTCSKPAQADI